MVRGRRPDGPEARTTGVHVRFAPAELARLDQFRGEQARSAFMRKAAALHIRHLSTNQLTGQRKATP